MKHGLLSIIFVCSMAAAGCQLDTAAAEPRPFLRPNPALTDLRCRLFSDMTDTVSTEERRVAEQALIQKLPTFLSAIPCSSLEIGGFADEGWFVRTTRLEIPGQRAVSPVTAGDKGDVLEIFGGKKQLDEQKRIDLLEKSKAHRREELERVGAAALRVFDGLHAPARPHCTAIGDLIALLNRTEAAFDLVITDGKEDCKSSLPTFQMTHPVIFVIVPEKGDIVTMGGLALERGRLLEKHFQGAKFILPDEIALGTWLSTPARDLSNIQEAEP